MKNITMKTIDLGKFSSSNTKKIISVIGKKLKENENKTNSKIDLGKLAEKLAERKEKALAENSANNDNDE